jgi:hydrophobic/amphiphilic exporter-1 (mainly G- bacteria), HAE1 family
MTPSVAALAVRRPVAVTVCAVAVALVGWLAWRQLPVDLLPDLQSPTVVVSVRSGDRPPAEMERLYGEQIEQRLFTVRGIREISQVARTGRLVATVVFDWDSNLDLGLVDVQRAIGPMSADPDVQEVLVRRFDPRQAPVMTLGLVAPSGRPDLAELRRLARRQVAIGLERLPGVAEVRITGGREQEVRVLLDRYKLEAFGITLGEVESRLTAENVDISAGTLQEGAQVYLVRGMSRFRQPADVERVVVRYLTGDDGERRPVRVADLGMVEMVDRKIDHLVRVNGTEGVGLSIFKEAGANTVQVSATVRGALDGLAADLPDVELVEVSDDASLIVDALSDLQNAAGIGVLLAVAVLAIFLRSAGATLIVSAAVPVSIFAALFLMRFADQSLNVITLGGLALGAGMLVDNAIVVVESIYRRLSAGESPRWLRRHRHESCGRRHRRLHAHHLRRLPAGALRGRTCGTPHRRHRICRRRVAAGLARRGDAADSGAGRLVPDAGGRHRHRSATLPARHRIVVRRLLRWPVATVALSVLAAAASIWLLLGLGTELLAPSDPRQFSVRVIGASGQRVASTARVVEGVESLLQQAGGNNLRAVLSEVGRLPEDDRLVRTELTEEHTARLTVRMGPEGPAGRQLATDLAPALATLESTEVSWEVGSTALAGALGTSGPPIVVEITGQSLPDLRRGAELVRDRLSRLGELWNVRSSFEGGPPELHVELDRVMADGLGVDLDTLSRVLETTLDGREVTRLSMGDEERPITLRLPTPRREDLGDVVFRTSQGRQVAIREVARLVEAEGAREIFRRDQRRTVEVTARITDGVDTPRAVAAVTEALDDAALPPGLRARLRGEEEERARTFGELQLAGVLAVVLVFMVLAGTFESLLHPFTVLAAIPLALIGVAIALVPMGQPIGVMAMLGLIVLAGIAVNDAVLLLATARQLMAEGIDRVEALARAAGIRLRPIIMTTLTTVLALAPLAVGAGEGSEIRGPMAMTIIGGLIASTVGSVLVLPALYLVLDRMRPHRRLTA